MIKIQGIINTRICVQEAVTRQSNFGTASQANAFLHFLDMIIGCVGLLCIKIVNFFIPYLMIKV